MATRTPCWWRQHFLRGVQVLRLVCWSDLKGSALIVSSYAPNVADTKGETTGSGETDNLTKYAVYAQMLADWFDEPAEKALTKVEKFELAVCYKFIHEPGQMKLLIVVDIADGF